MMKSILFVDDEIKVLDGLRRMLRPNRKQWKMSFVESAQEALDVLVNTPFDIIVTDMRMPGMDGADLLERVRERYPAMVRIVLSGHSEHENIMRSVRPAHQYLAKPVGQDELEKVLYAALQLHDVLGEPSLIKILGKAESLPALPQTYSRLVDAIECEDCSLEDVGKIIEHDLGMTATLLKVVNSAFFGLPRKISSPAQAASLLGLDILRSLVLSYQLFSTFEIKNSNRFSFDGLWRHSTTVGSMAKKIAQTEAMRKVLVDEAFMAGILHDVGKLILYHFTPKRYNEVIDKVRNDAGTISEMEKEVLGTSHAQAGAFLMGLWGMSENVVQAIAFHHNPSGWEPQELGLHSIVHAANVFEHELRVVHENYRTPELDLDHFEATGLAGKLGAWRDQCQLLINDGGPCNG